MAVSFHIFKKQTKSKSESDQNKMYVKWLDWAKMIILFSCKNKYAVLVHLHLADREIRGSVEMSEKLLL